MVAYHDNRVHLPRISSNHRVSTTSPVLFKNTKRSFSELRKCNRAPGPLPYGNKDPIIISVQPYGLLTALDGHSVFNSLQTITTRTKYKTKTRVQTILTRTTRFPSRVPLWFTREGTNNQTIHHWNPYNRAIGLLPKALTEILQHNRHKEKKDIHKTLQELNDAVKYLTCRIDTTGIRRQLATGLPHTSHCRALISLGLNL
ncbi:hypothetical protein PROFUN_12030 [Planoprotostelium fungivorum]|uniref:Uncharacterized protein n=1 Tax=Planoprotostelium fungivorum TaxID=1890364 RepID=A0A2P6MRF0_9EUKA|nr:hypothetical protein PROFUN_12030 [Planoprotostelium fungivorum]